MERIWNWLRGFDLHDERQQAREAELSELTLRLAVAGYEAYSNSLVGNPAPRVQRYYERASHPQVGDLVLEISRGFHGRWDRDRFGELVHIGQEHGDTVYRVARWPEDEDGVWVTNWFNASFIAIPRKPGAFVET